MPTSESVSYTHLTLPTNKRQHLNGAKISRYNMDCDCRKPKPGMILQAINKYGLIKENTFLVGDSRRDIEAAARAGIEGFLFEGDNLNLFLKNIFREKG